MGVWVHGCMGAEAVDAHLDGAGTTAIYGCMGVWVYGCMGVWVYGCMGGGAGAAII